MIVSIISSLMTLTWALALLLIIMYCFSVCFIQAGSNYLRSGDPIPEWMEEKLRTNFKSLVVTMYTLLCAISGGQDWHGYNDTLQNISGFYSFLFCFYIIFVLFGVMNVLTGVFVESATEVSKVDNDLFIQNQLATNASVMKQIEKLFRELDVDGSGTIEWEELANNLNDPRVQAYFTELQLDSMQAEGLFALLDQDDSGAVPIEEFMMGCLKLKGGAKTVDIAMVMYDQKRSSHLLQQEFAELALDLKFIRAEVTKATKDIEALGTKGVAKVARAPAERPCAATAETVEEPKGEKNPTAHAVYDTDNMKMVRSEVRFAMEPDRRVLL